MVHSTVVMYSCMSTAPGTRFCVYTLLCVDVINNILSTFIICIKGSVYMLRRYNLSLVPKMGFAHIGPEVMVKIFLKLGIRREFDRKTEI